MESEYVVKLPMILEWFVSASQGLSGFFSAAGDEFISWSMDLIPASLVALTLFNTIVALVGEDRFTKFANRLTDNVINRYLILPYLATFFLGNPASCVLGKPLKEKYKPAYQELVNRTEMAPTLALFPHVNPSELFVWLGVYNGVVKMYGLKVGGVLAASTFGLGLVTCLFNGLIVEKVTLYLGKRRHIDWEAIELRKLDA